MVEVTVPSVGESITEGTIVRWFKQNGEYVRQDEDLFELETEKATTNIPAPASGTVTVTSPADSRVKIGAVVGKIDERAAAPAEAKAAPAVAASKPAPAPKPAAPAPAKPAGAVAPAMSPAARAMVAERGIDPADLTASGRGKTIVKDDVLAHDGKKLASPPPAQPRGQTPRVTRQKMSPVRKRIAERLLASQQETATLTTFNEVDMSAVMDLRAKYKDRFEKKHGVGLGFMSFFVKAVVEALKAYPVVNASLDRDEVMFHNTYDISVAVSTEKGLFVPVLRDCDSRSFADIEKGIAELAAKARDGKVKPDDMTGGTFTITNGGVFGSMMSTPILNPPQSAILGMHAITKRPVVVNDQIVIRPMMYLALSYDHRLIDGRDAVLFLVRVKECVENPGRLLLDL